MSSPPPPIYGFPETTFISRTSSSIYATLRPWRELFLPFSSFNRPASLNEATLHIKRNLRYFRVNYTFITLLIIFFSLFWHPVSLIIFLIVFIAWFFLYFFRDQPLEVFNRIVDDRIVLFVLGLVTVSALLMTDVFLNLLVSILIGVLLILIHATFRATEDLYIDEHEVADGGLLSVVGSPTRAGFGRF